MIIAGINDIEMIALQTRTESGGQDYLRVFGAAEYGATRIESANLYSDSVMRKHLGMMAKDQNVAPPMPFAGTSSMRIDSVLLNKRIKDVDLASFPHRLVYSYEEAALAIHRSKRYVEELVASNELIAFEPGRISRKQVELYVQKLDEEALAEVEKAKAHAAKSPKPKTRDTPKRQSGRRKSI